MASQQQTAPIDDSAPVDDSLSRQDENRQGQQRRSRHSMTLRPRAHPPSSRVVPAATMPPPSSPPDRMGRIEYRASAATPEANNQRQLDFDNYGSPVDEGNEFLSLPTPSPQDMSRVWHNGSPSSQNFVIWEDPEGQPEPVSSTPEPTSDMDEDKENLFIRLPGDQTAQEVAQHTFSDRIDAQMGPLDAFGMPLQTHFDPDLTVRPHRNPRTSPDARIANPGTPLANRTFRPTTPTIIREGGAGTEDDFWTRNLFQAQPDQTARQANLFYRELRRRRGRGFVFRTDDNDWDEDDEQTETQDTIEFRRRRDRARDSEDDV